MLKVTAITCAVDGVLSLLLDSTSRLLQLLARISMSQLPNRAAASLQYETGQD